MQNIACDNHSWEELARLARFHSGELARRIGMTPQQLRREIRRRFGCPLAVWLSRLRLRLAESCLLAGKWVKEAASAACFKHVSSFCRWFTRQKGVSPSAFVSAVRPPAPPNPAPSPEPSEDYSI